MQQPVSCCKSGHRCSRNKRKEA